jgi:hypothetical protein
MPPLLGELNSPPTSYMNSIIECLISQIDNWINGKMIYEDGLKCKEYKNPSKPSLIPLSCGIKVPHYFAPYPSIVDIVFHFIIFQCTMFTYYISWPLTIHNIYKYTMLHRGSKLGFYNPLPLQFSLSSMHITIHVYMYIYMYNITSQYSIISWFNDSCNNSNQQSLVPLIMHNPRKCTPFSTP